MYLNAREISVSWKVRGQPRICGRNGKGYTYEFKPADLRVFHEVPAEVKIVHHLIEESKRMAGGRIHAEERNNIRVRKLGGYPDLLKEPLGMVLVLSQPRELGDLQCRPQLDQILETSSIGET